MTTTNYKLTSNGKERIKSHADKLLVRAYDLHRAGCPLTNGDVQLATTTEADRAALAHLRNSSYYIPTTGHLTVWLPGGNGVTVSAKLLFRKLRGPEFPYRNNDMTILNLDALDEKKRASFVEWLNPTVRQHRMAVNMKRIVREFLDDHCGDSVASIYTRWPDFLNVLLDMGEQWARRARSLPSVKLVIYDWPEKGRSYDWYLDNIEKLEVIGGKLASARMIPASPAENAQVDVEVVDWEKGTG